MKNIILILITSITLNSFAQGNRIRFNYDSAGNQIQRILCIDCPVALGKTKEFAKLKQEDLLKFDERDNISYYPNPVKEELFLKWELTNNNKVSTIQVLSTNGIVLKTFLSLETANDQIINFQEYSTGNYFLEMVYADGEKKSIQIIKK